MEKEQRENNDKYLDDNWNRVKNNKINFGLPF